VGNNKMDLRERMECYRMDLSGSGKGTGDGSCEHDSEPTNSIKCWEILE
jgi:hypothetical protein